jgi:hypothetical protein
MKVFSFVSIICMTIFGAASAAHAVEPTTCSGETSSGANVEVKLVQLANGSWDLSVESSDGATAGGPAKINDYADSTKFDATVGDLNLHFNGIGSLVTWNGSIFPVSCSGF